MGQFDNILNKYRLEEESEQETPESTPLETPSRSFEGVLSKYRDMEPTTAPLSPEPVQEEVVEALPTSGYSESDLTRDEFYTPILEYMTDRYGEHMSDYSRDEVVEKFTNNMRGFAGGNSVRAVSEIAHLNNIGDDEDRMARAGKAYSIYENMESLFGDTTLGEKGEIVGDFTRSALADPINLIGFGIGKIFTGTGFKGGSQVALMAAKKAYQRQISKGATKEAATAVGQRVFRAQARAAAAQTTNAIAQRELVKRGATTFLQRVTTPQALKEAGIVGGFEATVAAATDYMYQDALIRTKVQEDYSAVQTGLSALAGIVAGGVAAGSNALGGREVVGPSPIQVKTTKKGARIDISESIREYVSALEAGRPEAPPMGKWMEDTARGTELEDQDTDFFITLLLGNDELGMTGLVHTLSDQGYVYTPRSGDDKISNWIGDIIKQADPTDAKTFIDEFSQMTGITMAQGKELTVDAFADTFKRKMRDSGRVLNAASQAARVLGKNPNSVTVEDYVRFAASGATPETSSAIPNFGARVGNRLGQAIDKDIPDLQNNLIRLMVANLSTTAMNVTGYAAVTTLNSLTDISRGALLGSQLTYQSLLNREAAKGTASAMKGIGQNQLFKLRSTLDPNTTYDTFLKYAEARPESMRQLTSVLPGGVDDLKKLTKDFDPDTPLTTLRANQVVDVLQKVNLVQAQDMYTKSIEFTSQLDRTLRRSRDEGGFGMGWAEFFSQDNYAQLMRTERFARSEAIAIDETLKSTFSKSYKSDTGLGQIAGVIEDARNLPGIGLLVPFGRFFNNTVAFAADTTGILPLTAKVMGKDPNRSYQDIVARTAVSATLIGTLAMREMDYMDQGLSWSEEIDEETGEVIDEKFEFPYGLYKAAARLLAHRWKDEEVPGELVAQLSDQFVGQLTRQLGDVGAGTEGIITALVSEDGKEAAQIIGEKLGTIPSQMFSASTRFLDPANQAVGLMRGEDYIVPDRNQGPTNLNNALRYIDQFIAVASGEDIAPEKQAAASGTGASQATKFISTTRGSRLTNLERVMNSVGKPTYLANMASQSEVADNRYNEIFHQISDERAGRLFRSKAFKDGNLEVRQGLLSNLLTESRRLTLDYFERLSQSNGDRRMAKMIQISRRGQSKVSKAMKDLEFDKALDELSYAELTTLENALTFRDEFIGVK